MNKITAKIIADSMDIRGNRIISYILIYPRMIHSELMTHRMFCLDGDSILEFDLPSGQKNYKRVYQMTLKEFVNKWFQGDSKGRSLRNRLKSMKIRQLNEDTNKIETCNVRNCQISGEKEVFEIKAGNFKVAGSKDHRILTTDGWKTIENLKINEDFIISRKYGKMDGDISDSYALKKISGKWKSTWLNSIRELKLKEQENSCFDCGCNIEDNNHLHHVIPIYEDKSKAFDYKNIVGLCEDCHRNRHSVQGWQGGNYLYGEPVLLESVESLGKKETFDLEMDSLYENFVANGVIVHNSRNAASSRAIPFNKMVKMIEDDPFMPIAWQKDHKGMQGTEYFTDTRFIKPIWLEARDRAVKLAKELNQSNITKQLCNRLLEPFQWYTVLVTATEYDNFFELRCPKYELEGYRQGTFKSRKDAMKVWEGKGDYPNTDLGWLGINKSQAEIHIQALAESMWDARNESKPKELAEGEWHIPFGNNIDTVRIDLNHSEGHFQFEEAKRKIATARAARISYTNHDGEIDYEKDIKLHDVLLESKHMSPFEHCARAMSDDEYLGFYKGFSDENLTEEQDCNNTGWCNNFRGFIPYRYLIENDN